VKKITSVSDGSVYVVDTANVSRLFNSRLSYSKGAYLLHMLRWEMGSEQFFKALNNYLTDRTIANGFASQEKLVKHLETSADTSFTEFFDDWYYGEGYPTYQIALFADAANPAIQKIRVNQIPSHSSVDFFEMHLPIRVWQNGNYHDLRLHHTKQNQEFTISETMVDSIRFDPDKWLCAKADIVLPVSEITKSEQIQIVSEYSTKKIRVILPEFSGKEIFRIFDLNGRTVLKGLLKEKDSRIEINSLKKGVYLIGVETKSEKKVAKIIVIN
jgi:hypothetical protein